MKRFMKFNPVPFIKIIMIILKNGLVTFAPSTFRRVKLAKKRPLGGIKKDSNEIYTDDRSG